MLRNLPENILKYLVDQVPPYTGILIVKTSAEGIVLGWHGDPADYLSEALMINEDLSDQVAALFGMIPPLVSPMVLSRIEMHNECIADIHIVEDEELNEFWIFFVNQTKEVEGIRDFLQRLNESKLSAAKSNSDNPFGALHLLDLATFKPQSDGLFSVVGELPHWFQTLSSVEGQIKGLILLTDMFPFMEVFLPEATVFWNKQLNGNFKSGVWSENTRSGNTLYLNAYAINFNGVGYLMIRPLYQEFDGEMEVMQRAREQSLAFEKLAKAERKLKELLDYKDKFVSIVSHDLRSPVASVLSIAQMLNADESFLDQISDFNREMLNNIQQEMLRLLDYNDKLYNWSNLELGNFSLVTSRIQLLELVTQAERTAQPKLKEKHIEMQVEVSSGFLVELDTTLFSQVLNNLVANALKFTSEGGKLKVSAKKGDGFYVLSLADSGVGMSKEVADQLFQGFVRQSTLGTKGEKGTGLGMGIVKKILDAHGFDIKVDSVLGEGTTFSIYLPAI